MSLMATTMLLAMINHNFAYPDDCVFPKVVIQTDFGRSSFSENAHCLIGRFVFAMIAAFCFSYSVNRAKTVGVVMRC